MGKQIKVAKTLKYKFSKLIGEFTDSLLKILPTGGKSYPGYLFIKYAGIENVHELAEEQVKNGSILITGTNGKTTTTTMIIDLLSMDTDITKSVDNNTIYALTTALIDKKADMGVFEYGIRDIKHGQPDTVQKYVDPIGVVYTNISREHTQVLGVKNSFEDYVKAKTLLSQNMKDKLVIVNSDDPNTCYIGQNKENDGHVTYYGLEVDDVDDIYEPKQVKCPNCGKTLTFTKYYMNQRGLYSCTCGFKRTAPNSMVTKIESENGRLNVTIEAQLYNYRTDKDISFKVDINLPLFGIHNVYNTLAATTAYASFTPHPENIEENLQKYYNNMDFSILPPGRFEIFKYKDKIVGIGQGDNGDALKVNILFMKKEIVDEDSEFIYCTPDVNEEEIFADHLDALKQSHANHITVVPGRVSVDIAEKYYQEIKEAGLNASYHPIEYDFEKRITGLMDLIKQSEYKNIIVTGCGEEQAVWNEIKNRLKKEAK